MSARYHAGSSAADPACASMDEHSSSEPDTVQRVIFSSFGVSEVFMEVYLASACVISCLASLLPRTRGDRIERGEPRLLDFASAGRSAPVVIPGVVR